MDEQLVHPVESSSSPAKPYLVLLGLVFIVILGTFAGYMMSKTSSSNVAGTSTTETEMVKTAKEVGTKNTETFRDRAQGVLETGGINGEGTHHLVLDSNPKNSAYLVSSVIDLNEFVGKHVEIRGETVKATKAPWLMDVGYVKIIE